MEHSTPQIEAQLARKRLEQRRNVYGRKTRECVRDCIRQNYPIAGHRRCRRRLAHILHALSALAARVARAPGREPWRDRACREEQPRWNIFALARRHASTTANPRPVRWVSRNFQSERIPKDTPAAGTSVHRPMSKGRRSRSNADFRCLAALSSRSARQSCGGTDSFPYCVWLYH